ncbi:hypothetical protein RD1_4212 [Roseobacter denitrificans OCh 114]|uniref:Uncharacterized protein n=1 Tax=Roseobacter denitrificans (strain ATCC 33942 / OCh 114) TaxID=375451 RepID=Q160E4_ROSDO|nr:hypothetical protein RD1_4212 [Roseobacter denitrificans OCh 114]
MITMLTDRSAVNSRQALFCNEPAFDAQTSPLQPCKCTTW